MVHADPVLPAVEKVICVPEFRPRETRHRWHEIVVPVAGTYSLAVSEHGPMQCTPERVLVIPAGTEHRPDLRPGRALTFYCFRWWPEPDEPGYAFAQRADPGGRILYCCSWIWQLCNGFAPTAPRPEPAEQTIAHLAALIVGLLHADGRQAVDPRVARVIEHMTVNLSEQNRIGDLARLVGLSRDGLIRLFRRELGATPGQWLQGMRVERAVALLSGTTHPLAAIASQVGIGSGSHLSNLIKQATGRRPSQYRRGPEL
ncbi:MAG: helix-turn-helix domain-containing protein [Planctomycetota bacterium]